MKKDNNVFTFDEYIEIFGREFLITIHKGIKAELSAKAISVEKAIRNHPDKEDLMCFNLYTRLFYDIILEQNKKDLKKIRSKIWSINRKINILMGKELKDSDSIDLQQVKETPITLLMSEEPIIKSSTKLFYKCPLPGHKDNNPSFAIYLKTNTFYCHGCGIGGDTIELYLAINNLTKTPENFKRACMDILKL